MKSPILPSPKLLRAIAVASVGLSLLACGGNPSSPPHQSQDFALRVDPSSLLSSEAKLGDTSISMHEETDALRVDIRSDGAVSLKALYCTLEYDPTRYTPTSAGPDGKQFPSDKTLSLVDTDTPGVVYYGQVLIRPQQCSGFTGSGVIANIRFLRQPHPSPARAASSPPLTPGSKAPLRFQSTDGAVVWQYANQGDNDQNGEVNVSDLTPLAAHFGETSPNGPGTKFALSSVLSLIDGDGNGEINISDLTPMAANFHSTVESFEVFASLTENDYPPTAGTPSTITPLDSLPMSAGVGDPKTDRLEYTFPVPAPVADSYYWVRPVHSAVEGVPSEMDGDPVVVIAPNVRIVDGNPSDLPSGVPGDVAYTGEFTLLSHNIDASQILLTDPPGGETIFPGDIVVGFTYDGGGPLPDGGFLRRVTSVVSAGGADFTVETSDEASLRDVFLKGGFMRDGRDLTGGLEDDLSLLLPHSACGSGSLSASGLKQADAYAIGFNVDGVVLMDKRDGANFFTISLPQANFSFGPTFDVGVDFDKFLGIPYDLNSFHAIASGGVAANLEVLMEGQYENEFTEEKLLYHVAKDEYFLVGAVPVLITFTLDVYGGAEGSVHGPGGVGPATFHARAGFNLDYGVRMGILWDEDDGWDTVKEVTKVFDTIGPELKFGGSSDCTVYLRPEAGFALYHAIGAKIKIRPKLIGHLDGSFELGSGPFCAHWNLDGGIDASFGIWGKILGISLFDETFPLFDYTFDITEGELGCVAGPQAPEAGFQFGPTYVVDDIGPWLVNFDATYIPPAPPFPAGGSYDPDGVSSPAPNGIRWYEWDFDGDRIVDACSSDPTASFTYYQKFTNFEATLWVTDEEGMVTSLTQTVYIDDPIG